ncbi:hypothetical protein CPB83DRAFT_93662 [Crepidotus variabilis]|uniref:Uncharacterized protein n=1 Tax=Crepidotus variabilis TaxID=179855 RepID=A0A9P6E547_9AGAR|nr:hypothetical protein CPB83DRAFT_93662 [Crepidotus variabilis]
MRSVVRSTFHHFAALCVLVSFSLNNITFEYWSLSKISEKMIEYRGGEKCGPFSSTPYIGVINPPHTIQCKPFTLPSGYYSWPMAICLRKEGGFGERYERRVFVVQLLASLDPTYHPISHHQTAFTRSWFTTFTAEHRFSEMACQGYPHHEFDNALPFAVLSARRQLNFSPLMSFRSLWPLFV